MSVLEFIASLKWPVTVLLLAALAAFVLKRNPNARQSMGAWLQRRDLRVRVAGQEFAATVSNVQDDMGVAAGTDTDVAEAASPPASEPTPEAVEVARRTAIENVLRNAAYLGWQWAQRDGDRPPVVDVMWNEQGRPRVMFREVEAVDLDQMSDAEFARLLVSDSERDFSLARRLLNRLGEHSRETTAQQDELWRQVRTRILRTRSGDFSDSGEGPASGDRP